MKFSVDDAIFQKFPNLCIGVVLVKNIDNFISNVEIDNMLRNEENKIRARLGGHVLSQEPMIRCWREAYASFGAKPSDNLSSVENLHRRALKGEELRSINALVDIYNVISLRHMLPVGGEDTDKVSGNVTLCIAGENETPVTLLGDKEARPPHAGEVVYKDSISAICRRFNWREADRTKLDEKTKNALLVIEGLPPATKADVANATEELASLIKKYCNGSVSTFMLSSAKRELIF
ncbi:MAG: hypothetical protein HY365_01450 [Candidatus Aenigmarchaeota archaeon]|nr:hypothetical protein [Candidatus Aenigmarchaeota archaeon]